MIDTNWSRWIKASLADHFNNNKGSLEFYVEGDNRERTENKDRMELRINGPTYQEGTKDFYMLTLFVNVLITTVSNETDLYQIERNVGTVCVAFARTIPVYKYGDGDALLDCMVLGPSIRVTNFGQITETNPIMQTAVEGSYNMELTG